MEGDISSIISHGKNSLHASNSSSNFELEGSFVPRDGDIEGGCSDSLSLRGISVIAILLLGGKVRDETPKLRIVCLQRVCGGGGGAGG